MVLSLAVVCPPAFGQPEYVLKFNHVLGQKEPYHLGFTNWAKAVGEKTKGDLKIEVFHSAQLGVEEDILEQIKAGANIGQNTDSARMGMYVPGIACLNGPYFAENLAEVAKLTKAPTIKLFHDELANKHGLKVLSFSWVQGYRHFFTNKPIRTPEDLGYAHPDTSGTHLAGVCARSRRNPCCSCLWRYVPGSSAKGDGGS